MTESGVAIEDLLQHGYRYALSLTHRPEAAEDLVHDACVAILRADGPWHRGYLFATIRHRFIDGYRRSKRVGMIPTDTADLAEQVPSETEQRQSLDIMIENETIEHALGLLRPAEREAMYLFAIEGYTAREIGELTDKPRGTILSLIHRARHRLLDTLTPAHVGAQP